MTNVHIPSNGLNHIITEFFLEPTVSKSPPDLFSTLYLLRRDSAQCLGINPNTFAPFLEGTPRALWPGLMGVFAGIDLLSKFYKGNSGSIGERFKEYCKEYVVPDHKDWAKSLWKLRNSLMHSFSLYGGMVNGKEERYVLTAGLNIVLKPTETTNERFVHFDVFEIWRRFEDHIPEFRAWLNTNQTAVTDLKSLFIKYGFTRIDKVGH